jgi:hypothetical protein
VKIINKKIAIFCLIGGALFSFYLIVEIFRSTSSTAAIGILFLPFFAALGGLAGGVLGFVIDSTTQVLQKKITPFSWQMLVTYFVVIAVGFGSVRWQKESAVLEKLKGSQVSEQELIELYYGKHLFYPDSILQEIIRSPKIPLEVQKAILAGGKPGLLGRLAENPNIAEEIFSDIALMKPDYQTHYAVAESPKLKAAQMEHLLVTEVNRFPSSTEFHLYQTYVLAKLVKRQELTEAQFRKVVGIPEPETFLLYALLESPYLRCANFSGFSGGQNPVLENAIQAKREKLGCP